MHIIIASRTLSYSIHRKYMNIYIHADGFSIITKCTRMCLYFPLQINNADDIALKSELTKRDLPYRKNAGIYSK